jgi:2,4-dienoyl-CoA reductase-like NADH-dependent reductase (Old Yellow Enzyme family)
VDLIQQVVEAVHLKGSFIYLQLLTFGRLATPAVLRSADPTYPFVSASNIPIVAGAEEKPRPMTTTEIDDYICLYAQAAENAMEAGFDGIEIHSELDLLSCSFFGLNSTPQMLVVPSRINFSKTCQTTERMHTAAA